VTWREPSVWSVDPEAMEIPLVVVLWWQTAQSAAALTWAWWLLAVGVPAPPFA
jgi:hypothetical protein